jgi:hypothetical protein
VRQDSVEGGILLGLSDEKDDAAPVEGDAPPLPGPDEGNG